MELVHPDAVAYAEAHTSTPDPVVAAIRAETQATMLVPQMAGGLVEAKLLEALVVATRATRVLEVGTFTGVSAISMAARLAEGGTVVTLESDPGNAEIARRNIDGSPYADRIELVIGDARTSVHEIEGPFDVVFVDAWKQDYPLYYEALLPKLAPHGILVADNALRSGTVIEDDGSPEAATLRTWADAVAADPRVDCALLTVGDGLLVIWQR